MLTKVDVLVPQGQTVLLSLQNPANGYVVKDIDGLDPVKAVIVSSHFASMDGEEYQSSRREKRNIIIKLDLKPEYTSGTVRDLRNRLYGIFMPKTTVRLRFYEEDETFVDIYGMVESFDCPLFIKDPEATISLLCFDSDFYTPDPIIVNGNTTPYDTEILIDYEGTVETGIQLHMNVNRTLPAITIHHRLTGGSVRDLAFVAPLIAGDVLDISTVSGDKGATLLRGGISSSVLYGVSPVAIWTNLFPGSNYIRVSSGGAPIAYTIEYTNKYGGL